MSAWRNLGAVLVLIAAGRASTAEVTLTEAVKAGDCFRLTLTMNLTGEIRVTREDRPAAIPLSARGEHNYPERILAIGDNGLPAKSARIYEKASATIRTGTDVSERTLRLERRLLVSQRHKDHPLVYSPAGSLTREELELTSEHFDTLFLTGLLPGKAIETGATWKVASDVAQALCCFEGLSEHDLTGKLEGVQGEVAVFTIKGTAQGIDLGSQVKMTVDAVCRFDLKTSRLTEVEWLQKDEREQGPANPASTLQTKTSIKRAAIELPVLLNDRELVAVPDGFAPPASLTTLYLRSPKSKYGSTYDLVYARDWQVVTQTTDHLVMRLMERGDFVAQVTVTPWTAAGAGKHMEPQDFAEKMASTPGWEIEKVLQAEEVKGDDKSRYVFRISALGQMDGTAVLQNFYLIANSAGDQVVVVFTMTPKQADKLGSRDLTLVGSLDILKK